MGYIKTFFHVFTTHSLSWWGTLLLAYSGGIGIFKYYGKFKASLGSYGNILPVDFPILWLFIPLMVWLIFSMAHRETMRHLSAGKITLDPPAIIPNVPLYGSFVESNQPQVIQKREIGENDIIHVVVRNQPYEMSDGKAITDAYGSVSVIRLSDSKEIINFDYARWMENEKPGYQGNPGDRYKDEWNFRTIKPNQSPNRLDFIVKSRNEDNAYGFRGRSQLIEKWHDDGLVIPPDRYRIVLTLFGVGMKKPYQACYEFVNQGAGKEIDIRRTDRGLSTSWIQANT